MSYQESLDLLAQAKEVQRSYHLQAERDRQAREARKSRRPARRTFKYQLGQHLLKWGQKLAPENEPSFEQA